MNCTDLRAYAATSRLNYPDTPTYHEALTGVHVHKYEEAMKIEIRQIIKQSVWGPILRSKVPTTSSLPAISYECIVLVYICIIGII